MAERGRAIKRGLNPAPAIDASGGTPHLRFMFPRAGAPVMHHLELRRALSLLALLTPFAAPAAFAQETPAIIAPEGDRFALQPADGGFLRLNKETGAVSYCSAKDGVSVCRLGADERAALETEIERLRAENARLKAGLAPQAPPALPGEQEFERALSFTERFLRRIMRLFKEEAPTGGGL